MALMAFHFIDLAQNCFPRDIILYREQGQELLNVGNGATI